MVLGAGEERESYSSCCITEKEKNFAQCVDGNMLCCDVLGWVGSRERVEGAFAVLCFAVCVCG